MKYLALLFVIGSSTLISGEADAGKIDNAYVTSVYCGYYNGANMCSIYFDRPVVGLASCASTQHGSRMQIRTDDDTGKAILSVALLAYEMQKPVDVRGKNTCTIWTETEDMEMLRLK